MHSYRRQGQIGYIHCPNLLQFFAATLVGLKFPPAWNALTFSQVFDNFLNGFLGNSYLIRDLCANPIKFGWYRKIQVVSLNLCNLFGCWCKRRRRWNLLALWFGWSWGFRHFSPCRFASLFPIWLITFRARFTA